MKISLLCFLLIFCLVSEAHGIRFEKGFQSTGHQKIQKEEDVLETTSNVGGEEVTFCKDGKCSGNNRKLMNKPTTSTTSTLTATTPTRKNEKSEANKATNSRLKNESSGGEKLGGKNKNHFAGLELQEVVPHEHYPDIIDLAGMDYSPARRKPPIHN
ncbi:hypothetical protein RJ641_027590 [Dillenia turbinata]|uniref:Uncharacterized protein n=1 Tax=Dillenia turbinata TaxID=194707 RepID=A0AAN8ZPS3_9MAGN